MLIRSVPHLDSEGEVAGNVIADEICFWRNDDDSTKPASRGAGAVGQQGGLLRDIRVESEIGRQAEGRQALRNESKVEGLVLEQVRRIFDDEVVWPSFWTFLV